MLHKTHVDLAGDGEDALRVEAIVEPAVWIPDFPGDEPDMEYTSWRDLLFVYSEVSPAGGPVAGSANA
jgi:hypothetical protein